MAFKRILIANRGEIAVRIARAAAELGIQTVSVSSKDDAGAMHGRMSDADVPLDASGPRAYLDSQVLLAAAARTGCDAVHPGYGFLSENADFARECRAAGFAFIGPSEATLRLLGDKGRAREFAVARHVPVPRGTAGPTSLEDARAFMRSLPQGTEIMVKAISGGGGRGMRRVAAVAQLDAAFAQCASEAEKAFGHPALYVEQFIPAARHIEVQVLGDGRHAVQLGDRDCSIQRRHQKIVEIAPSPWLDPALRRQLTDAALALALESRYETVGTFEFLVPLAPGRQESAFFFMEVGWLPRARRRPRHRCGRRRRGPARPSRSAWGGRAAPRRALPAQRSGPR
jgi:acetyl/propionyl-CoA carboxylase alpha subunit